ncbi:MAG: DUF1311 domain-containing protein [Rhizobiales bacterium]|nr:DUF1311 domain-containing protein [Hyphomicrobiales bacterium]MBI3673535.1 DUF1311 domain-containing protein [Hyphomicrobiales bacterium]
MDFQEILKRLEASRADDVARFKDAQSAWLKFRDAECEFVWPIGEGGSARPMVRSFCFAELTKQRLKDMQYYLTCEEGDLSCPTWVSK